MIVAALLLLQATMPGPTVAVRVQSLLARTPIPVQGQVAVFATTSADTVYAGDQLEILTTAWFPASVRERLRRPPTLRPPTLSGVYSLPVYTLPGVAASRTVGETVYDLFASHQVVFPVSPGWLQVPSAGLGFSLPAGRQYFGDEQRDERESAPRTVMVLPLPSAGRPDGFAGPVARDLRVAWRLAAPNARLGEMLTVDLLVGGEGNLSLWSAPEVQWPDGVRVYPDRVDEAPEWRGSRLGGIRRFRFLVMPDSAGSFSLPALRYPFFDPQVRAYRVATAAPMVVPVLPAIVAAESRAPLPWATAQGQPVARRLVDRWGGLLLVLLLVAPMTVPLAAWQRRRRVPVQRPTSAQALLRFERLLDQLVGEATEREHHALVASLRRAGVARLEAEAGAGLHERLRQFRFARPEVARGREEQLAEEAAGWLARLPAALRRGTHPVGFLVLLLTLVLPARAQAPSAAELYREGAWAAAVTAQRRAVAMAPGSSGDWYNYGAALWMAREDGRAAAAWLEAYRLAPRDGLVRRAWNEAALRHEQLRALPPRVPVTPDELLLAGGLLWLGAVGLVAARPRRRRAGLVLALTALVALGGGAGWRLMRSRPMALTTQALSLRDAPHGLAGTLATVDGLALVPIEAREGGWLQIRDHAGRRGWVPAGMVASLRGLD